MRVRKRTRHPEQYRGSRRGDNPGHPAGPLRITPATGRPTVDSALLAEHTFDISTTRHSTPPSSMRLIGQLGQRLGLVIPAVAIILELNHSISLGQMLTLLVGAVCLFWIGRIVEGYSPS